MSWSLYLLQINIYLVIFYGFYHLLLSKETYFKLNRVYLIGAICFALAVPFLSFNWVKEQSITKQVTIPIQNFANVVEQQPTSINSATNANPVAIIAIIYIIGAIIFAFIFTLKLVKTFVGFNTAKSGAAFSFWHKKFVDKTLPSQSTINAHEDVHVKQLHTFDILLIELVGIITWFNPIIYFYKIALKELHEYLADDEAAKHKGDKSAYAMLLLTKALGAEENSLSSAFYKKSMVKKRIVMLYKEKSKKTAIIKYGIAVPLFALALVLSSATVKNNDKLVAVAEEIKFTDAKAVVAEAVQTLAEKPQKAATILTTAKQPKDDYSKFYKFLRDNIKYRPEAHNKHIQGNVIVNFNSYKNKITSIEINPKIGYGIDDEIKKVLRMFDGDTFSDGKYSIKIENRLNGATTPIINENAIQAAGHTILSTVTIMAYVIAKPDEKIYSFVSLSTPPTYPGGIEELYKFLNEHINYPAEAKEKNITGNVFMSFAVEKDGSITDIKIDRSLGYGTDEEAVRVIKLSEKWNPGLIDGKPVRVKYNIPIKFDIKDK